MDRKQLRKIMRKDYQVDWKNPDDVALFLVRVRNALFIVLSGVAALQLMEVGNFYPIIGILVILAMICEVFRMWKGKKKAAIFSIILLIYCAVLMFIMFFM